jgi:hypothetical protein
MVSSYAFLWEHSDKRLKLAQLLGQLGVFLTRLVGLLMVYACSWAVNPS